MCLSLSGSISTRSEHLKMILEHHRMMPETSQERLGATLDT